MTTILEDAAAIVAEREYFYDIIVADFYFMTQLSGDLEMQLHLWQEAWDQGNNRLIMLLLLADLRLDYDPSM